MQSNLPHESAAVAGRSQVNSFANVPLDRCEELRRSDDKLDELVERNSDTRCIIFQGGSPLVKEENSTLSLVIRPMKSALTFGPNLRDNSAYLLGQTKSGDEYPLFVVDVTPHADLKNPLALREPIDEQGGESFMNMRACLMALSNEDLTLMGYAHSVLQWHSVNKFCGKCGNQTTSSMGGAKRVCSNAECSRELYPRTDPVVIMLVTNKEMTHCVLGRGVRHPDGMFSCLAGFLSQGETIEEAVKREIMEEVSIECSDVLYHSSQPWPLPHSQLMIGCIAVAGSDVTAKLKIDPEEIAEASWFSRAQVETALAAKRGDPGVTVYLPPPFAIAHQLIKSWVESGRAGSKM